jgi:predicted O-methyltransferase YrrM
VYSSFHLALHYLRYYLTAANGRGHGTHSPFVFDFILHVLNNRDHDLPVSDMEQLRKQLLSDKTQVDIRDLGAGSRSGSTTTRQVATLATSALKPKKYAQLLYRVVRHYRPATIVELGASLGLTTAYLSRANPGASIITIEGSPAVAALAEKHYRQLKCHNIQLREGNFDEVLPLVLQELPKIDLAYIDGNHRYQPTMNYFHQFLAKANSETILVFDDIHWSVEMEKAWEEIKTHSSVTCTIDIFFLGFVFFKNEFKVKQDFVIRF